ncbi:MAG: carboxypeptidase-like regulatory domain-containing protein [Candidatus Sericytochromatia bacterium]|nr:carboxypeptidase-like regulatory domain-containing protein [Candidatus Sericytochromatia bacterium]
MPAPFRLALPLVPLLLAGGIGASCGTLGPGAELIVRVVDARSGQGVPGATVEVDWQVLRTAGAGAARVSLRPGAYELTVSHGGYEPSVSSVMLAPGATLARTVGLRPRPEAASPQPSPAGTPGTSPTPSPGASPSAEPGAVVFGKVTDGKGGRLAGALVLVESTWGVPLAEARTTAVGEFRFPGLPRRQPAKFTAIADGHRSITRVVTPAGEWRLDFTGVHALAPERPPVTEPGGPPVVKVDALVTNALGTAVDGAVLRAESEAVRFPFATTLVTKLGHAEFLCPSGIPVRFTATKVGHRPITFVERLEPVPGGGPLRLDFKGGRALVPAP